MKRVDAASMKRAGLVGFATLVVLVFPRPVLDADIVAFLHRPWVLILGPLLMAGLSFFAPTPVAQSREEARRREVEFNRSLMWRGIAGCSALIVILVLLLIGINAPPVNDVGFTHRADIYFGGIVAILVVCLSRFVVKLRRGGLGEGSMEE